MQPLYFLAGAENPTRETINQRGLEHVFDDVLDEEICATEIIGNGPGGQRGWIVAAMTAPFFNATTKKWESGKPPRIQKYLPDVQTWTKAVSGKDVWIGIQNDDRPKPEDIQRRRMIQGQILPLDSGFWLVPTLRRPNDTSTLPRKFRFGADGLAAQPIEDVYLHLWEQTAAVVELFITDQDFSSSAEWLAPLCLEALALNYRIGADEQNAMGVMTSTNWSGIAAALIGYYDKAVRDDLESKKNARQVVSPATTSSSPGPSDDCQTTGQLAGTCTN